MNADSRRLTKADFDMLNKLLDTRWFATPRMPMTEIESQFVFLMLAGQELYSRNQKYPTLMEARAERQRQVEHREKLNRDYFASRTVKSN